MGTVVRRVAGAALSWGAVRWGTPLVARAAKEIGLVRASRRGTRVPTAAGAATTAASVAGALVSGAGQGLPPAYGPVVVATLAGLLDDVSAGRGPRGWRAHWRAWKEGRPRTGILKAAGIALAAGAAGMAVARQAGIARASLSAASAVLGANLLNQLDTAPGRSAGAYLAGMGLLALAAEPGRRGAWWDVLPVSAAVAAYLPYDRRGEAMLGDAGANALGSALGWTAGQCLPLPALIAWVAALAGLNVGLDRWSLSGFLEGHPKRPFRWAVLQEGPLARLRANARG
ncbi:MAG: hypothetical protein IMX02_04805 [Limnochordaceae bacterium]|nr:hypothetical protein [Limnochordaceae bacterium]